MKTQICKLLVVVSVSMFALACTDENQPPGDESNDGETGDGDGDEEGDGDGDGECVTDPSTSVELLNACTDAACDPFPNTPERLPLLEADGSLPPLP